MQILRGLLQRQKGHTELYRGTEYTVEFVPKLKIEAAMVDGRVEPAIEAINRVVNTGNIGDGKIFVSPVEDVYTVSSGVKEI